MKKQVSKLIVYKNKTDADKDGMLTYKFEWVDGDNIVMSELLKIQLDEFKIPIESYDLDAMITHKQHCCLEIDTNTFAVEIIEL